MEIIFNDSTIKYLLIGEVHREDESKEFILNYANKFAEVGFEIVGSEFYQREISQSSFDAYHWGIEEKYARIFF